MYTDLHTAKKSCPDQHRFKGNRLYIYTSVLLMFLHRVLLTRDFCLGWFLVCVCVCVLPGRDTWCNMSTWLTRDGAIRVICHGIQIGPSVEIMASSLSSAARSCLCVTYAHVYKYYSNKSEFKNLSPWKLKTCLRGN